ncbi:MAG: SagB/ThcOx family dehydrogenase [Candidatus Riflebacteria bacterium]
MKIYGGKNMGSDMQQLELHRSFLKDFIRLEIDFSQTAQSRGLAAPPLQKPVPENAELFELPEPVAALKETCSLSLSECVMNRESVRKYSDKPLTMQELSALLYATQGVKKTVNKSTATRTVPSGGSRHAFETYLSVDHVEGLEPGLYRYLPFDQKILLIRKDAEIGQKAAVACMGQLFVAKAAVTFFWTAIPERMEWRYGLASHKVIAIDSGHVCQNLYLACTAMKAGTCAIAAYSQNECDKLLEVDGTDEFTIYIAPVGKF